MFISRPAYAFLKVKCILGYFGASRSTIWLGSCLQDHSVLIPWLDLLLNHPGHNYGRCPRLSHCNEWYSHSFITYEYPSVRDRSDLISIEWHVPWHIPISSLCLYRIRSLNS